MNSKRGRITTILPEATNSVFCLLIHQSIQKSQTQHPSVPEILKSRPSAVHGHLNHICKKKLVVERLKWYLRTACHCVYVA